MAIKDEIADRLKQARRDRDERTINVIGLIKNKVLAELKSGKDVTEDDALWTKTIAAYAKGVSKAIPQFRDAGERGAEALEEAQFELAFCEHFLPKKLDEAATEALVRKLIAEHSITDASQMGKLMGVMMKAHKDELDGALARSIAQRVLAEG
jgi:uncharacterized protein YqeY